ncbi:hypothetical protein [Effusibacillus consociatus]|uniref:ABC transporter permease n=1 Tax=Effusibacillus consociatus TaxID=1117041 RepID=A0ABV9Q1P3_9BACL
MSMVKEHSVFKIIHGQRWKKIYSINQLALSILFDKTTLFYLIPVLLFGFFVLREIIVDYYVTGSFNINPTMVQLLFSVGLLLLYVLKGNIDPRFKLTNSDYALRFLPLNLENYLRYVIIKEQAARAGKFAVLLVVLIGLNLLSFITSLSLFGSFLVIDFLAGLLQWKLFQKQFKSRVMMSVLTVLVVTGVSFFSFLLQVDWTGLVLPVYGVLIGTAILVSAICWSLPMTHDMDWQRSVYVGQEKTWNLFVYKIFGGFNSNRSSRRPWIHRKTNRRKANDVSYDLNRMMKYYWRMYFASNKWVLVNILTNTMALNLVISSSEIVLAEAVGYTVASFIAIFVLVQILTERLNVTNFRLLPWSVDKYAKSFAQTTVWVVYLLVIPQAYLLLQDQSLMKILLTVTGEMSVSYILYLYLLKNSMRRLLKSQTADSKLMVSLKMVLGITAILMLHIIVL